jgi:hypothetical protein
MIGRVTHAAKGGIASPNALGNGVKGTGTQMRLTFWDRSAGNDHHGQDVKEIEASHGWPLGLAATLCRSSLTAPVCPLIRARLQDSRQRQPAKARHDSRATRCRVVQSMRCDAMRCDAVPTAAEFQSVPTNRARPPTALPLTRKPGLDAMEQSGSCKGRYCLVQPAWLVPSMQRLDLLLARTVAESTSQGPKGQPRVQSCRVTAARGQALSR